MSRSSPADRTSFFPSRALADDPRGAETTRRDDFSQHSLPASPGDVPASGDTVLAETRDLFRSNDSDLEPGAETSAALPVGTPRCNSSSGHTGE